MSSLDDYEAFKERKDESEDLSEEELESKMKQILDDYSQIINVTPEKITE